jgi:hypothetical protein
MLSLSGGKFVSPKIYQVVDDVLDAVIGKSPKVGITHLITV